MWGNYSTDFDCGLNRGVRRLSLWNRGSSLMTRWFARSAVRNTRLPVSLSTTRTSSRSLSGRLRSKEAGEVDGCPKPKHAPLPKNRAEWWAAKLARNRDARFAGDAHLAQGGLAGAAGVGMRSGEAEELAARGATGGQSLKFATHEHGLNTDGGSEDSLYLGRPGFICGSFVAFNAGARLGHGFTQMKHGWGDPKTPLSVQICVHLWLRVPSLLLHSESGWATDSHR